MKACDILKDMKELPYEVGRDRCSVSDLSNERSHSSESSRMGMADGEGFSGT